eukprot:EG_transcript_48532
MAPAGGGGGGHTRPSKAAIAVAAALGFLCLVPSRVASTYLPVEGAFKSITHHTPALRLGPSHSTASGGSLQTARRAAFPLRTPSRRGGKPEGQFVGWRCTSLLCCLATAFFSLVTWRFDRWRPRTAP